MALFTLVYATYRPGGFDLLVESLKNQNRDLYELVVVDNYENRPDRGTIPDYILKNNIPLRAYTRPSIPFGTPPVNGMARAFNTGALCASTDHVIIMNDYCWLPPGWAYQWRETIMCRQANTMICGTASLRHAVAPIENGDITIWPGGNSCWVYVGTEIEIWKPQFFETFHTYFPIHFFESINGLDERGRAEEMGAAMFAQAQWLGYQMWVEPKIRVGMIDHRAWGGDLWSTSAQRKDTPEQKIDVRPISPNAYNFKDLRDELLHKQFNGVIGL